MKTELENDKKVKLILSIGEILKTHIKAIDVGYEVRYNDLCMELVNFVEALSINRSVPTKASLVKVPTKELKDISDEDAKELASAIGFSDMGRVIRRENLVIIDSKDFCNEVEINTKELDIRRGWAENVNCKTEHFELEYWQAITAHCFLQSKGYKLPITLNLPTNVKVPTDEEIKQKVVEILGRRLADFESKSHFQTYEIKQMHGAIEAVQELIPPDYFNVLSLPNTVE